MEADKARRNELMKEFETLSKTTDVTVYYFNSLYEMKIHLKPYIYIMSYVIVDFHVLLTYLLN